MRLEQADVLRDCELASDPLKAFAVSVALGRRTGTPAMRFPCRARRPARYRDGMGLPLGTLDNLVEDFRLERVRNAREVRAAVRARLRAWADDLVVLAGDISSGLKSVRWARRASAFAGKPVVLVPGNHEFYGLERTRTLQLMRELAVGSNVRLLDRDEVTPCGVRFLGTTLWTDFALDEERGVGVALAMADARAGMIDFAGCIRERAGSTGGRRPFTPESAAQEHFLSRAWLLEHLQDFGAQADVPTVVVTHHAPSPRSMVAMYEGSELNPCFYSNLPEEFFQHAKLWIHGHSHSSADYLHHRTRVLSNPRGYVNWTGANQNDAFRSDLVVEIGGQLATQP